MNELSTGQRLDTLFPDLTVRSQEARDAVTDNQELGKTQFLELMIAQLENQDPLAPKENGEFIAQLAQFSSLEGINNMSDALNGVVGSFQSSVALQASSLVGREVLVPASSTRMDTPGGFDGVVELDASTANLQVQVLGPGGQPLRTLEFGAVAAGEQPFTWDGLDADGQLQPAGTYSIRAMATDGGQGVQVATQLAANVDSVTVGTDQTITLNLAGAGSVPMAQVKQFR